MGRLTEPGHVSSEVGARRKFVSRYFALDATALLKWRVRLMNLKSGKFTSPLIGFVGCVAGGFFNHAAMRSGAWGSRAFVGFVLALTLIAQPAQAQLDQIIQQLEAEGQARVIVRMKSAGQQPDWAQAKSVVQQRSSVRQMRQRFDPALAKRELVVQRGFSSLPFVGVQVDRDGLGALLAMEEVADVYPVMVERKAEAQRTIESQSLASSVSSIDVQGAWARGYEGEGFTVAVIDGGIATSHPMLAGKSVGDACFSATFGNDTFTQCPSGNTPEIGTGAASNCPLGSSRCDHGTHVASIAVGNDGTTFGVARGAQLMPIDVFSEVTSSSECAPDTAPCELTDSLAVLDALNYVNENVDTYNIVAVNLSLGGGAFAGACDSDPRKVVIDMLREKGVATVSSAGNQGSNSMISAPSCISAAVAVGATNDNTVVASFSNFTPSVDLMAPGVAIRAARASGGLVSLSGTSMAAPHVAGAYALINSAVSNVSVDAIDGALKATGTAVSRSGQNFSLPRIQVNQAILDMQGINIRVFNNVIGSRTTAVGESYVRLHNASTTPGRARVTLRDAETGAQLGRWTSPDIPAHASFQFNVSRLESEAESEVLIARDDRTYYNLVVESGFAGSMQHILWQQAAGVLSNMTSCTDGVRGGERTLLNVHSPSIVQYQSSVRIYNSGALNARPELDIYNATTGELLGRWAAPQIDAGAAHEAAMGEILAGLDSAQALGVIPVHLNVELAEGFNGYLQHTIRNMSADVLTDMSAKCALGRSR
ncbi:MAG: S8 family serine peptidase [Rhodospirillaceae bacterium]